MKQKPIVLKLELQGGKDSCIPVGVKEKLTIEIVDEMATYHFIDGKTTKKFILDTLDKTSYKAAYSDRIQKGVIYYPGLKQMDLVKKIKRDLEELQL